MFDCPDFFTTVDGREWKLLDRFHSYQHVEILAIANLPVK